MSGCSWIFYLVCVVSCGYPALPQLADDVPACTESTDLASDSNHCGRCDHSCGGADCLQGECQPLEIARDVPGLRKIAITDTAIYWTETQRIASCPLPEGCVLAPRSVADPFDRLDLLTVQGEELFFVGCTAGADSCDDKHRLFQCPTSGCPLQPIIHISTDSAFSRLEATPSKLFLLDNSPKIFDCSISDCSNTDISYGMTTFGSEILGFAVDRETLYVDVSGDLRTCPVAEGCATPGTLTGTASIGAPFVIWDGIAFWATPFGPGLLRILTCTVASCSSSTFANATHGVTEIKADESGLYWINSTAGTIRHCPLSGCPNGGATYVVRNLSGLVNLTLGPGFVYYTVGTSIYKVAKP